MTRSTSSIAVLALLLAGEAWAAMSAWDETQLQLLEQYSTPLRWYNIEGPPHWVSGPKLRHRVGARLHLIHLQPGEEVTLRAPAHTWLRLAGEAKTLGVEDLEVMVSTDARAFAAAALIRTMDPYSLLVSLPQDRPSLVRLNRPAHADSELVLAAYLSREEPFDTLAPYRQGIRLPGKAVRLRRDTEAASQRAWAVTPEAGTAFPVEGPARVQLVARLPWPCREAVGEQALVVQLSLDGAVAAPLLLSAEPDARHRTRVNHSTELVSHGLYGFVSVPEGKHLLRLQPAVTIYLSVFSQSYPDFLLPWPNAPATNALRALRSALATVPDSPALTVESLSQVLSAPALASLEQAAWSLALENNRLDAGGQAADWLDRLSQTRRDYPVARQTAAGLWRQRTVYREILPAHLPGDQPLRQALFAADELRELFEPEQPVAVYNPTVEQVRDSLSEGYFAAVPHVLAPGLLYELPRRSFDSRLRIAAVASAPAATQFFVQYDQGTPLPVRLEAGSGLPARDLEPVKAFATLRILEQEAQLRAKVTRGQPMGEFDLPIGVLQPGIIELALPQSVRQVRIYQEAPATPVMASVAYRAAKPFQLGEASYLALLRQCDSAELLRMLSGGTAANATANGAFRQVRNHLVPLMRLLQAHVRDFTKSIDPASAPRNAGLGLEPEAVAVLKPTAETLENDGKLLEALEVWSRLFWTGGPHDRAEAALGMMRGLEALGEDFLAAQYARYALLEAEAPQLPAAAIALLDDYARQAEDTQQAEVLRAFVFMRCPCPEHLAGLVESLSCNSHDEMTLAAGLLLANDQRPAEMMLAAALHLNWWQTFDQLVEGLPGADAKSFWRAQKHLAFYRFTEAEQELKEAGAKGAELLRALETGRQIREQLAAPGLSERLAAGFAWEQWQAQQPGPRTWQNAEDVLYQCASAELLFNSELDQFAHWYRAERGRPVKLRFLGPARLQIEARPVLELPFERPVDDWLEIAECGITNRVPISQCVPNPSLQFATSSNALVGLKTMANLEWGPGLHEVEVSLAGRTGLIHVQQERPVLPTRILPALNAERLRLVLEAGSRPAPTPAPAVVREQGGLWWVPAELARRSPQPETPSPPSAGVGTGRDQPGSAGLTRVQNLRLALRMGSGTDPSPPCSAEELRALPAAEQWLAAGRWKRWDDFSGWQGLPEVEQANYLLATGQIRQLLDAKLPHEILPRLVTLLQVAEGFPAWRAEAQHQAELLAVATNVPPGSKKILLRLTKDLAWAPLPVSPLNAGLRPFQVPSDLPQDPAVRLRRALLPPAGTNQFTLGAQNEFTASMTLQRPAEVQVRAELAKAGFSPLAPVAVSLQVDAETPQHLQLTPLQLVAGTNFTLGEGRHLVRMWIKDPVINEFVRVSLASQSDAGTNSIWAQSLAEAGSENRFFQAATLAQPIRFSWKGPALLRLDEWREGRLVSQLRAAPPGEQTIEIQPAPGQSESWYRIFVRTAQTNQPEVRPAWAIREPEEVPPPKLRLPEAAPISNAQLTDYYRLGGQEDGTWGAGFLLAHRRPFELGGKQNAVVNEFAEANGAYRKVTPSETLWFKTEALTRVHRPGDLTFGLAERIEGHPKVCLFDWAWSGEAFVGSTGPDQSEVQGALHTALEVGQRRHLSRKLDCYPYAGGFARYLTLTRDRAGQYDYVDQDLYTRFRSEHRWGWVLGNQLEYQPWLDTFLEASVDLVSNEDFTPDHWGMRCSWDQMLGPLRGEVAYQFRHSFSDTHRSSDSFLQGVSAGLYAEYWVNGRHRLELGAQYRHDWPDSADSYFLVFRWEFSQGRGYKDHSPRETVFRDLRSRRIPAAFNNLLDAGVPGAHRP